MLELNADNAEEYLRTAGHVDANDALEVSRLTGGVSNEVLYVAFPERVRPDFVLKQARDRLRVPEPWHCSVERIWREVEVLRVCDRLLGDASAEGTDSNQAETLTLKTPTVLFEDRENYCFAMTAAPRHHVVWKHELLAGRVDCEIATACGRLLGRIHGTSWNDVAIESQLSDRQIFDELRLDPYFRFTAAQCPKAARYFDRLVTEIWQHRLCLVHADFSPKNLLVYHGGLLMVDFETGHYGDPAFDLGFFLSHLLLKAFHAAPNSEPVLQLAAAFWKSYGRLMLSKIDPASYQQLVARGLQCLAGCAWARLDGKSGIDYLEDVDRRHRVRELCMRVFVECPTSWSEFETMARQSLAGI